MAHAKLMAIRISPLALLSVSPDSPALFRPKEQTLVHRHWWLRGLVRESRVSRFGSRVSDRINLTALGVMSLWHYTRTWPNLAH